MSNSKNTNPNPSIQVTGSKEVEAAKRIIREGDEQVASYKPQQVVDGIDTVQTDVTNSERKNFDEKIYMFPESYNALRRELYEEWPEIWPLVGWYMANNAQMFVNLMNEGTGLKLQFDTSKVESICLTYLNFLRNKRGVSNISS